MVKRIPKLPDTLKVGAMVCSIEINNEWLKGAHAHGEIRSDALEIKLNDERPLLQRQKTALHEAIHAVSDVYCQGAELCEEQVTALAQGLLQAMHDNPEYTAFILAR